MRPAPAEGSTRSRPRRAPIRPVLSVPPQTMPAQTMPVETRPAEVDPLGVLGTDLDESTQTDKPWLVIVWNDPINLMSFVTYVLQKLFGYSKEKATKLMLDVHHKGRAVVSSGTRERAELDVYRLHEHGLWATMEQSS
jgi:ATP-dependent Clp protease adaptor protein ClpS